MVAFAVHTYDELALKNHFSTQIRALTHMSNSYAKWRVVKIRNAERKKKENWWSPVICQADRRVTMCEINPIFIDWSHNDDRYACTNKMNYDAFMSKHWPLNTESEWARDRPKGAMQRQRDITFEMDHLLFIVLCALAYAFIHTHSLILQCLYCSFSMKCIQIRQNTKILCFGNSTTMCT